MYAFVGPILLVNLLMFCVFTYSLIWGIWAKGKAKLGKNHRATQKAQYITVVKMFFVLGVTWICEVVSHGLGWKYGDSSETVNVLTAIFTVINSLRGVIMFFVIVVDNARLSAVGKTIRKLSRTNGGTYATNSGPSMEMDTIAKNRKDSVKSKATETVEIDNPEASQNVNDTKP